MRGEPRRPLPSSQPHSAFWTKPVVRTAAKAVAHQLLVVLVRCCNRQVSSTHTSCGSELLLADSAVVPDGRSYLDH
jgi:hypothetical protein